MHWVFLHWDLPAGDRFGNPFAIRRIGVSPEEARAFHVTRSPRCGRAFEKQARKGCFPKAEVRAVITSNSGNLEAAANGRGPTAGLPQPLCHVPWEAPGLRAAAAGTAPLFTVSHSFSLPTRPPVAAVPLSCFLWVRATDSAGLFSLKDYKNR